MEIKILNNILVGKIAAGEVVDRPASVVKELLENSIDANATNIVCEVINGGLEYIRIKDNGKGMDLDDLKICAHRFTTSKISVIDDLEKIRTMGFRGEALFSISAVSDLSILSKKKGAVTGFNASFNQGEVVEIKPESMEEGTIVEVRNIFKCFPARLKFIKSDSAENRYIHDVIEKFSLPHLLSIKLISDGKEILNLRKESSLQEKLSMIWSMDIKADFLEVSKEIENYKITGLISKPGLDVKIKTRQLFFVNKRIIQSKILSHAFNQAYKTHIMRDRYPLCCIFIDIRPDLIDVNVHPRKMEIKFKDEKFIYDLITKTVEELLVNGNSEPISLGELNKSETPYIKPQEKIVDKAEHRVETIKEKIDEFYANDEKFQVPKLQKDENIEDNIIKIENPELNIEKIDLKIIGQVKDSYIIYEDKSGIVVVDQHAAEERILFEKYLEEFKKKKIEIQFLLLPIVLNYSSKVSERIINLIEYFNTIGFIIEKFGENTFRIKGFPAIFIKKNETKIFKDITDLIIDDEVYNLRKKLPDQFIEKIIMSACKSATKANQHLSDYEMIALLENLKKCKSKETCPHGRLIEYKINFKDLEKKFGRKE